MIIVVGAGFTGATVAEHAARSGERVIVVERRARVGGSAEDYRAEDGLLIQKYGPHVFHTNSPRIWEYVCRFGEWRAIKYKVAADIEAPEHVPLPFGFAGVRIAFPETADGIIRGLEACYGRGSRVPILKIKEYFPGLSRWVIEKIFRGYNEKHWGLPFEEVPESVLARLPIVIGDQESYFTDKFQAVPVDGYTRLIERMLDHPLVELALGTDYAYVRALHPDARVVYTGSADEYYCEAGALPYRSVLFKQWRSLPRLSLKNSYATITYPMSHGYTRTTEMLLINGWPDPCSYQEGALVSDYPCAYVPGENDPFYPIPLDENIKRAKLYRDRAPKNVWFAGRLGSYQYLNMDQAIAQGMLVFEKLRGTR